MLRKKVKEREIAKVDQLIAVTQEADRRGMSTLRQLTKHLRPKAPKRSIHFRRADGLLMTIEEEMDSLRTFFSELYQSTRAPFLTRCAGLPTRPSHRDKFQPHLWKLAAQSVEAGLLHDFNAALHQGRCVAHNIGMTLTSLYLRNPIYA